MKNIISYFKHSYRSDKIAFFLEMSSFIFHVIASVTMAVNARNPNLLIIYPFSLAGGLCAFFSVRRRKLAWPLLSTVYALSINTIGLLRASNIL